MEKINECDAQKVKDALANALDNSKPFILLIPKVEGRLRIGRDDTDKKE